MERAAAVLGRPLPTSPARKLAGIAATSARLWFRGLRRARRLDPASPRGAEIVEAATIVNGAAYPYYLAGETLALIYCLVMRLDLTDRLTPTGDLVQASTGVAYVWGFAGFFGKADRLNAWALATADALNVPRLRAFVLYSTAVLDIGRGNWSQGEARAAESAAIYADLGEHRSARDSRALHPYLETFHGAWAQARRRYELLRDEARGHENLTQLGWACFGLAKVHYRCGELDAALEMIDEGLAAGSEDPGAAVTELALLSLRACVRARSGDTAAAGGDIASVRARIDPKSPPAAFMQADAYGFLADACCQLLMDGASADMLAAAETACAALQRAARVFPAARPASMLWKGVLQARRGAATRAERTLRQALAAAERMSLVFEQQRAAEEISRLSGTPAAR
jgi:tetratricopeptide (TPR) repeat protein